MITNLIRRLPRPRGTEGSNPSPSSGESGELRNLARAAAVSRSRSVTFAVQGPNATAGVRRAGARRRSITKEWCYGPRNAPTASGHCPYSRPAPKPNRQGKPPVSARIARRLDDLLERVALLPIGEPPRPQVRPEDKPYSIAFLCSYACGTNSLSRFYVRASTVI